METITAQRVKPLYRGVQVIWYLAAVIEILLVFRFILKLLGANAAAGFTSFIYSLSNIFVGPFNNVFGNSSVAQGSVFEWTTLLAMLFYAVIAWGIVKIFAMSRPVSTPEAHAKLYNEDL